MSGRFKDELLPGDIPGFPCISSPRWSTAIVQVDSGTEQVNQRWQHPLHRFTLPDAIREHSTFEDVHNHWLVMRGPLFTFPFRDPLDFASTELVRPNIDPGVSGTDQVIGTGDGVTRAFQLVKTYTVGAQTYQRDIIHPVTGSVVVTIDGVDPAVLSPDISWTVSRTTGIVTFDIAPNPGAVIRAGYLFDVEVRFESDTAFDGIVQTYGVSGYADITLIEVRPC